MPKAPLASLARRLTLASAAALALALSATACGGGDEASTPTPAAVEATPSEAPAGTPPPETAAVAEETEPNDTPGQANGPAAASFQSTVGSPNDADWFYFRVQAGQTVAIAAQHVEGDCSQSFVFFTEGPEGQLFSSDKITAAPRENLPETGSYTAPADADGYVVGRLQGDDDDGIGGAEGCVVAVNLSPAEAVLGAPSDGDAAFLATIDD